MCRNTRRLKMLLLVTIGFACAEKNCPDQCGQAVACLSNTAKAASNICASCKRSAPSTIGAHIVDLFSRKTVHWESQLAWSYHAYDPLCLATPIPTLSESAAVWKQRCKPFTLGVSTAGCIHYYTTDMRRPHGVWLMAWAWNRWTRRVQPKEPMIPWGALYHVPHVPV